ncbi:MAG: hypothetical protein GY913_19135 [Proteobacteria bacterium]|nr:hypothetical protein [Pseudomonadota bacterium]MCP4919024.1 hypothetical protein [Pseudomonadota bacterium]
MPLTLVAHASPGLCEDPVRWVGRALDGAPRLSWVPPDAAAAEAVDQGLAAGLDALVAREPLPPPLLDLLAARSLDRDPETALRMATRRQAADPRWSRALARAAARSGTPAQALSAPPVHTRLPEGRRWARAAPLADGVVLTEATGATLHRAALSGPGHSLVLPGTGPLLLPHPTGSADRVLVVDRAADDALQAWLLSSVDEPGPSLHGRLGGTLLSWADTSRGVRLQGERGVAWLESDGPGPTVPAIWPYPPPPTPARGGRLLLATPDADGQTNLTWRALDDGTAGPSAAWRGGLISALLTSEDGAWVAGEAGLFELSWEGQLACLDSEPMLGLTEWGDDVVALGERGWARLSTGQGGEYGPEGLAHRGRQLGQDLLLYGMSGWRLLSPTGEVLHRAADRGDASVIDGPDGTVAVLCGTDLACFDASSGRLRARTHIPFDGALYGATLHALIVATVRSGNPRTSGSGWLAYDANLGLLDQLLALPPRRPSGTATHSALGTDQGLLTSEAVWWLDGSDLVQWRPEQSPPILRPEPALREVQDEVTLSPDSSSPMDAWPRPGLAVDDADVVAQGCTYGGSGRYAQAPAVDVRTGRVAVLDRCLLAHGGDVAVGPAATLILVACTLPAGVSPSPWKVGPSGLLAVLDASGLGAAVIDLAPGARLWIDGEPVAEGPAQWRL